MRDDELSGQIGEMIRYGAIETVDLPAGRITVRIGDILTQPVRFFTGGAGGTRVWSRPKIGEQVMVLAPDGDIAGAIAMRGVHCDAFPSIGDPNRELVMFEDGAVIAYDPAAHRLEAILPGGSNATITADDIVLNARVRINGQLEVSETIKATGDISSSGDVKVGATSLKTHTHSGVQAGAAFSGPPR